MYARALQERGKKGTRYGWFPHVPKVSTTHVTPSALKLSPLKRSSLSKRVHALPPRTAGNIQHPIKRGQSYPVKTPHVPLGVLRLTSPTFTILLMTSKDFRDFLRMHRMFHVKHSYNQLADLSHAEFVRPNRPQDKASRVLTKD